MDDLHEAGLIPLRDEPPQDHEPDLSGQRKGPMTLETPPNEAPTRFRILNEDGYRAEPGHDSVDDDPGMGRAVGECDDRRHVAWMLSHRLTQTTGPAGASNSLSNRFAFRCFKNTTKTPRQREQQTFRPFLVPWCRIIRVDWTGPLLASGAIPAPERVLLLMVMLVLSTKQIP
jgi:hypothetical protein